MGPGFISFERSPGGGGGGRRMGGGKDRQVRIFLFCFVLFCFFKLSRLLNKQVHGVALTLLLKPNQPTNQPKHTRQTLSVKKALERFVEDFETELTNEEEVLERAKMKCEQFGIGAFHVAAFCARECVFVCL
jgi:hypothetical protein